MNKIYKKVTLILLIILALSLIGSCETCNEPDFKTNNSQQIASTPQKEKKNNKEKDTNCEEDLAKQKRDLQIICKSLTELDEIIKQKQTLVDEKNKKIRELITDWKGLEPIKKIVAEIDEELKAIKKLQDEWDSKFEEVDTKRKSIAKKMLIMKKYTIDDIIKETYLSREEIEKINFS